MAHTNKVIRSINLDGETICVDVFLRPDGSYGFDEFRRDPEDGRGWYSIGHHGAACFGTFDQAFAAAKEKVSWLTDATALIKTKGRFVHRADHEMADTNRLIPTPPAQGGR